MYFHQGFDENYNDRFHRPVVLFHDGLTADQKRHLIAHTRSNLTFYDVDISVSG